MCDASNSALRAVLGQIARVGKLVHMIAYASQTIDSTQLNYTTIEKELLAIVFSLDKFYSYLLGSKIFVFSDHPALRFLLKKPNAKSRLIWWMLLLQEFNIEIIDKKGSENSIADHLSLMPIRDQFLDEQLLHINTPTLFHRRHLSFTRKKSKAMPNTTYEMILTYGDFIVTKSFGGAFLTPRSIRFSSFAMQHLEAPTMDLLGLPKKCWIADFIGPPFSETLIN
ncbi:Retrovirus-related Pol polyprotein from transposon 17.6, partial [Mucuna pruriens]